MSRILPGNEKELITATMKQHNQTLKHYNLWAKPDRHKRVNTYPFMKI